MAAETCDPDTSDFPRVSTTEVVTFGWEWVIGVEFLDEHGNVNRNDVCLTFDEVDGYSVEAIDDLHPVVLSWLEGLAENNALDVLAVDTVLIDA